MNMNGTEEQSGLCEGEGECVGHFSEGKVKFMVMAGSGDYMRLAQCRPVSGTSGRISSRALWGPEWRGWGVRGPSTPASFSRLAVLRLCSCTSLGLLWIGLIRPSFPSPPPSLIFFASVELLAS